MTTRYSSEDTSSFVRRRILRDWDDDIEVLDVFRVKERVHVEIGCSSPIACEQARISLAGFVANDRADWDAAQWKVVKGDELPFRIRLIEPKPEGYVRGE